MPRLSGHAEKAAMPNTTDIIALAPTLAYKMVTSAEKPAGVPSKCDREPDNNKLKLQLQSRTGGPIRFDELDELVEG